MAKKRIVVMYGGKADEHSISCISTAGVLRALDVEKFEAIPVGITKTGQWIVDGEDPRGWNMSEGMPIVRKTDTAKDVVLDVALGQDGFFAREADGTLTSLGHVDAVLPVLHGPYGEDGTIQGLFEMMNVPYVGCGVFSSAACMDKHYTKVLLAAAGIPVAPGITLDARDYDAACAFAANGETMLAAVQAAGLRYPLFVKPSRAGSSFGVTKVEREGDAAELAAATHNSGGIVIAQVRGIVSRGSLPPKGVRVHHPMVDYVVVNTDPALHMQSHAAQLRPELSGQLRRPTDSIPPMPLDNRKLIARRGALELRPDCLINLGIGIPSGVGVVANEEGIAQRITLSLESGPQGGVPVEGAGFGSAVNAEAIYTVADTLELYDGGMLDLSFLGAAEVDCHGNVNVSKFGSRCTGPGGFVNISQNTKRVFFTGTFTAGGLKEEVRDGRLVILQEGRSKKFRRQVEQITFSGDYAVKSGQDVTFLTERAVLKLTPDGLMLTEIAPGVELEQDILAQMEFRPLISPELREMDHRIFQAGPMGLTL